MTRALLVIDVQQGLCENDGQGQGSAWDSAAVIQRINRVAAHARASGVPVIVPDRGGAADHADDGAGLRYAATDPEALAAAILVMAETGWPREAMMNW